MKLFVFNAINHIGTAELKDKIYQPAADEIVWNNAWIAILVIE